jgi:hypothetical protein
LLRVLSVLGARLFRSAIFKRQSKIGWLQSPGFAPPLTLARPEHTLRQDRATEVIEIWNGIPGGQEGMNIMKHAKAAAFFAGLMLVLTGSVRSETAVVFEDGAITSSGGMENGVLTNVICHWKHEANVHFAEKMIWRRVDGRIVISLSNVKKYMVELNCPETGYLGPSMSEAATMDIYVSTNSIEVISRRKPDDVLIIQGVPSDVERGCLVLKNVSVSRCKPNPTGQPAFFLSLVLAEPSLAQFHTPTRPTK